MGEPGDPGERDLTYDDLTPEEKEEYKALECEKCAPTGGLCDCD
ncbi:hypothetical protein [Streptomyces sp. 6N223]